MLKIVNICTAILTSTYFEYLIKIIINIEFDDQLVLEALRLVLKLRYRISNKK